jgi:hypothetical protein
VILICILLTSCNQEELDTYNETYFIDLIKNQIEENDEVTRMVLIKVDENGNKPVDVKVATGMLALKTGRNKLLEETLLNNFEYLNDTLISEYQSLISKVCQEDDSFAVNKLVQQDLIPIRELNQLQKTPNKFEKIIWAYQCMILENTLLERYATQIGSRCFFRITADTESFSDTKNISLGKACEVIFVPVQGTYKTQYDIEVIYDEFTLLIDSVETKINYEFEQVGFAGFVSFVPPKKGSYQIRGKSHIKMPKSAGFRDNKCCPSDFSYEFEVK